MRGIRLRKQKATFDKSLFVTAITLTLIGLVAVADASAPQALSVFNDKYHFVKEQLIWAFFGIGALLVASKINYRVWEKVALPIFLINLVLLILVLVPGIGLKVLGARRWISVGNIYFQPSEMIKLSLALFMAKLISSKPPSLKYFLPLILVAGLIMAEPDLGTTISVSVLAMSQIFASGINLFSYLLAIIAGIASVIVMIITSPYRKERLLTFLQITRDPLGKSYHIRQILLALGSGGLFGIGLGQSRQKFLFLPEAATDSIFAVIAEEIGFLGASVLIIIFLVFIFRALRIVKYAPDKFSQILSLGLTAWVAGQTILNIGSIVALFPLTGIPLPFISYGGSSLVTILFATGILLNISKYSVYAKKKR